MYDKSQVGVLTQDEIVERLRWEIRADLRELTNRIGEAEVQDFIKSLMIEPF